MERQEHQFLVRVVWWAVSPARAEDTFCILHEEADLPGKSPLLASDNGVLFFTFTIDRGRDLLPVKVVLATATTNKAAVPTLASLVPATDAVIYNYVPKLDAHEATFDAFDATHAAIVALPDPLPTPAFNIWTDAPLTGEQLAVFVAQNFNGMLSAYRTSSVCVAGHTLRQALYFALTPVLAEIDAADDTHGADQALRVEGIATEVHGHVKLTAKPLFDRGIR